MWKNLYARYATKSETAHITLARKQANKSLAPGGDVNTYETVLAEIYKGLETCGENIPDKFKIAKLITSFPPEYDSICAAIRSNDESRTWNSVLDVEQDEHEEIGHIQADCRKKEEEESSKEDKFDKNDKPATGGGNSSDGSRKAKKAKSGKTKVLMAKKSHNSAKNDFIINSGATRHMVTTKDIL